MPEKTQELEGMATECRNLAKQVTMAPVQEQLLEIADQFERLAADRQRWLAKSTAHTHNGLAFKVKPNA
jgi:hypothetical protein